MSGSAPVIAGHRHLRVISQAGGYGDVHLYEDETLQRHVAIKVIRDPELGADTARLFLAEATTMAKLAHPNIVQVYESGLTADGRPYISMQYCQGDSYDLRVRRERLPVPEVLATGIRIGSAVQTAHEAGLLHRDIKPANILKTPWGAPGLTDFGVAHQMSADEAATPGHDDVGVSPPWSPPEMIYTSTNGSPASDVYSLAATLWHLLVGRSPFEIPGGDNSSLALLHRIKSLPVPRTERADVPDSLERVLRQAMAKDPNHRPQTMAEFIRNLQSVEQELRLSVTESVVTAPQLTMDQVPESIVTGRLGSSDAAGTVIRPRRSDSQAGPGRSASGPVRDSLGEARTQLRGSAVPVDSREAGTVIRPKVTQVDVPAGPDPQARGGTKALLVTLGVGLLVISAVVGFWLVGRGRSGPVDGPTPSVTVSDAGGGDDLLPPGPVTVKAARSGTTVTFTWDYSAKLASDQYRWQVQGGAAGTSKEATTTVTAASADPVCLQVIVVRLDGSSATKEWSAPGCG